ncbi:exopolysaccharide biosynthesis WecB/TagA/CpsF family protein [Rhodobium orientis]|uniref:Glycosyltransferase n=1 Tax=Rhodobium orientis TaxID=34017 RepID=A0A327JM55_9HYPH|nr:WecB/TagA/CpsF family glycosyltransferase [Rhodobium orientis]MBB4304791.1 exopolysaccharide biosynthesis WecB/TagA/CpsF family protein [Rhodobium orientis]MBK5948035.1 glycosyltransferase [Rhodobium orientis]RAI27469.1 glycosyltransferase [Rhodobium orientis]
MIDNGKKNVLGVGVSVVDYDGAVEAIIRAARARRGFKVAALAVHGVMTGVLDRRHRYRLNSFDVITPDGQPVRWALNLLHRTKLKNRVYGPELTLRLCERAARENLPIYLYGSKPEVLERLQERLAERFPGLVIAGARPSLFRKSTAEEKEAIAEEIRESGARLVFVGLGCPRQEVWAYEYARLLDMPAIAVGAAFDFHAGLLSQAPRWFQDRGLEWAYRLSREPKRLWRRYLLLNPAYLTMLAAQALGLARYADRGTEPGDAENFA